MAKRPDYYLRVVRRVPRLVGGYENVYVLSQRGWNKINYYRAHTAIPVKTFWDSIWNAGLLLNGKGSLSELEITALTKWLGRDFGDPALLDDLGNVLVTLDEERFPVEGLSAMLFNSPSGEKFRTVERALYLQKIGLIPKSVNIPFYLLNNQLRGISDATSLITLLIRRGIELGDAPAAQKAVKSATERSQTSTSEVDHQKALSAEKKRNETHEKENDSLRSELADTRLEKFKLGLQNDNFRNHILNTNRLVTAILDGMEKIEKPSFDALAIKSIVYTGLTGIAVANYLTFTQNKSNA